jgi:hypothetical protein
MRPSDEEEYSTTYSSETYTTGSSFDEEDEEISDDGRSYSTRSKSLDDRVNKEFFKNIFKRV